MINAVNVAHFPLLLCSTVSDKISLLLWPVTALNWFVHYSSRLFISGEAEGLLAKANAKASAVRVVADAIAKQVCC